MLAAEFLYRWTDQGVCEMRAVGMSLKRARMDNLSMHFHRRLRGALPVLLLAFSALAACGRTKGADGGLPDTMSTDGEDICFACIDYWVCGNEYPRIDLVPEADGCYLSGLPGRNLLSPDGTVTSGGEVVGEATGTGARVSVTRPDGSRWLYCAGGGGCRPQ
jgi:hypothetical protein